jgi:hypothetical protein
MTILRQTIILNTLADNAADAFVDASGNLQITGAAYGAPKATSCSLTRQNAVSETLGVVTTTFTAVSGATYVLKVFGGNAIQGGYNPSVKTYTYTATSTDTATTIGDVFRAFINADVNILNIVATGTTTLICTAKTGFAEIFCTTTTANTVIVQTTAGVPSIGQGTVLATDPSFLTSSTYGTFTAGATYTRWTISWSTPNTKAAPSSNSIANNEYVLFINNVPTSNGAANLAAVNLAAIQNTSYGTLTLLQAGYRAIVTTATPTIGIASNIATLGGSGNSVITAGIMPNDWVVADPIIAGTASAGQVLALGAGATAGTWSATLFYVSAGSATGKTFTLVQVRNLPR